MIECDDCGGVVGVSASACPHCGGVPYKALVQAKSQAKMVGWLVFLCALVGLLFPLLWGIAAVLFVLYLLGRLDVWRLSRVSH